MGIEVKRTHGSCCGHRSIGYLQNVDAETGKIQKEYGNPILLSTLIKEHYDNFRPCALWSWISNGDTLQNANRLKAEFVKLGYTVVRQRGIENQKSGNTIYMYIAKRTAKSKV